jgi:hypothetical protein
VLVRQYKYLELQVAAVMTGGTGRIASFFFLGSVTYSNMTNHHNLASFNFIQ